MCRASRGPACPSPGHREAELVADLDNQPVGGILAERLQTLDQRTDQSSGTFDVTLGVVRRKATAAARGHAHRARFPHIPRVTVVDREPKDKTCAEDSFVGFEGLAKLLLHADPGDTKIIQRVLGAGLLTADTEDAETVPWLRAFLRDDGQRRHHEWQGCRAQNRTASTHHGP